MKNSNYSEIKSLYSIAHAKSIFYIISNTYVFDVNSYAQKLARKELLL